MPKANELKRGYVVEINNAPYVVQQVDVKTPSSRGAVTLYKVRFRNVQTGQKLDETFKSEDMLREVELIKRPAQYLYRDGETCTFMDLEDYSQYTLSEQELENELGYLKDGLEGILVLIADDKVLGIELPSAVNLKVEDTVPALKGASATSRTKPARLETGLEVQVPEYIENGAIVRVSTETGKYVSRA
jgi:elongation factor P